MNKIRYSIIIKEYSLLVSSLGKNVIFHIFPATDAMRVACLRVAIKAERLLEILLHL